MVLLTPTAYALMPLAKPAVNPVMTNGQAAPFAGSWAVTLPTMEVSEPDMVLASCRLPVRIEAASDTHVFYLAPEEVEADAAMELIPRDDGTFWSPIAGGPSYFAFWIDADNFYLYDEVPEVDADWGRPYIYKRCN
jgi:hypothetical protein